VINGFEYKHPSNMLKTPLLMTSRSMMLDGAVNGLKISLMMLLELFMRTADGTFRELP
jgi:hypothetical protein